jgi:protocatechuate 3,4-dioxygenase beta subunit
MKLDRRGFLQWTVVGAGLLVPVACGAGRQSDAGAGAAGSSPPPPPDPMPYGPPPAKPIEPAAPLPPTEACVPTEDNIQGPFFTRGAPNRAHLAEAGMQGQPLRFGGRVLDRDCRPIPGARMEVWQADHAGAYDLKGFHLRGHLLLADDGAYTVHTIIPGRYLNGDQYRPAHIHVKLAAPGYQPLTTQLYFAGDPYNDVDPWIKKSLIMQTRVTADRKLQTAQFDFVLPPA